MNSEGSELQRIQALSAPERLEYFLEQLLEQELCWALESGSRLLRLQLEDGRMAIPVFPGQDFAALEAADASEQPKMLGIEEFFEGLLPELSGQGLVVGVFPVKGEALLMEPMHLYTRILEEWEGGD